MRLYVSNLPWELKKEELVEFFKQVGEVNEEETLIITRRDDRTGEVRSKGYGFVDMPNDEEAKKAIDELSGKELGGRAITVAEARPREERKTE